MEQSQQNSALRAKINAGKAEGQARRMSIAKALRLSLARAADDLFDMALATIGVTAEKRLGDDLPGMLEPEHLLILLDGAMRGCGAVMMDAALVGGLVQQQTMGKVQPPGADAGRRLTPTDAAICAPLLDALFARAAPLPDDAGDRAVLGGFRFGAHVADVRQMAVALDAPGYHILRLTIDIAGGVRQGVLTLILPETRAKQPPSGPGGDGTYATDATDALPPGQKLLARNVLALNVELKASLCTLRLPLNQLDQLRAGDALPLGVTAFDQARILTVTGTEVGKGVLGQIDGTRALRVEHRGMAGRKPQRRAEDRAELDLPEVTGDGTGTRREAIPLEIAESDYAETVQLPDMDDVLNESLVQDILQEPKVSPDHSGQARRAG